jgi:hypothetical protein
MGAGTHGANRLDARGALAGFDRGAHRVSDGARTRTPAARPARTASIGRLFAGRARRGLGLPLAAALTPSARFAPTPLAGSQDRYFAHVDLTGTDLPAEVTVANRSDDPDTGRTVPLRDLVTLADHGDVEVVDGRAVVDLDTLQPPLPRPIAPPTVRVASTAATSAWATCS